MKGNISTYCLLSYNIKDNNKYNYMFKTGSILTKAFKNLAKKCNINFEESETESQVNVNSKGSLRDLELGEENTSKLVKDPKHVKNKLGQEEMVATKRSKVKTFVKRKFTAIGENSREWKTTPN
jgi:hypothetical protein